MGIATFGIEILLQKSRLYGDRPHSRGGACVSVFRERDVPIRRFRKYGAESTGKGTSGDQKSMKLNTLVSVTSALLLTAGMAKAAHVWEDPGGWSSGVFVYDAQTAKYTANELSLDLAGSFYAPERGIEHLFKTNIRHTGKWGGDAGLNYFFTRYVGISGNIEMPSNGHNFIDQATGEVVLRWPIDPSGFAPYILGGGGRSFEPAWEWIYDVGVGVEYRLNPITGIFTDARYVWADHSTDRLLLRAGDRKSVV